MLLIHGARSALGRARQSPPRGHLRTWAVSLEARRGHNKATVALANKLARIAYAVCKHDTNLKEDDHDDHLNVSQPTRDLRGAAAPDGAPALTGAWGSR